MIRIGKRAAWGLLVAGPGCAGLQRAPMPQEAQGPPEIAEIARAEPSEAPRPIDPFHPPVEPASTRMARFFPGLARFERANAPVVDALRQGSKTPAVHDRDLEAVPRPEAVASEEPTATAAIPRRGLRLRRRGEPTPIAAPAPAPEAGTRVTAATRRQPEAEPREPARPEVPVLAATVVAEVDPADIGPPEPRPARGMQARDEALVASAALSPRRSPPLPEINPTVRRPLPPRTEVAERREEAAREDDHALRARGRADFEDHSDVVQPLLAVGDEPDRPAAPEGPEAPASVDRSGEPEAEDRDDGQGARPAEPEDAGPPPIDAPPTPSRGTAGVVEPEDPDSGGDPVLAGRPRMARPSARREDLMPGVPPVRFPRTYYGQDTMADGPQAVQPSSTEEVEPRWSWRPRLLQRLRGQ